MKILIFSSMALVGLLLVGLQHQQIGRLRAENAAFEQSATETDQLKAALEKATGNEAQDAEEIERLREENHDLLRLRNEVSQLRDAREAFEKVRADNQRLQSQARNLPRAEAKPNEMQPIVIQINNLYDRGFSTPENAVQTFFWAARDGNIDELSRRVLPENGSRLRDKFEREIRPNVNGIVSITIVARRELNANTVQLGVEIRYGKDSGRAEKAVFMLTLRGGEWKLDMSGF